MRARVRPCTWRGVQKAEGLTVHCQLPSGETGAREGKGGRWGRDGEWFVPYLPLQIHIGRYLGRLVAGTTAVRP